MRKAVVVDSPSEEKFMIHIHRQQVRLGVIATVTAALTLPVLWTIAPLPARAAAACTQVISGPNTGVLSVAANQKLCLKDAVQTGAINVASGGSLSMAGSTVIGALTLNRGFSELDLCGNKVVGAISATGGRGVVTIGGAGLLGSLFCPSNIIEGAVTLDANQAGVILARNSVAGAVTATANIQGTAISGNRIAGALTCATNVPAAFNAGLANTVGGGRSGEACTVPTF